MTKKLLAIVLGLAALLLNPFVACNPNPEPNWKFGAAEMRAAVEGTWTITVDTREPGVPALALEYTVTITQGDGTAGRSASTRSFIAPAAACGNRSFVRSAAACADTTKMPLDVQIVKGPSTGTGSGELEVFDAGFGYARLEANFDGKHLDARITQTGETSEVLLDVDGSAHHAFLSRVAPLAPSAPPAPKT